MEMKKIIILIGLVLILNTGSSEAAETFNQTYSFNGGGTNSEIVSTSGTTQGEYLGNGYGELYYLNINFDNNKILSKIYLQNTFYGTALTTTISLHSSQSGVNENYTTFNASISGQYIGDGFLGWERTTSNNYRYKIVFVNYDSNYAKTLSGIQKIDLNYDKTWWDYQTVQISLGANIGYKTSTYTYSDGYISYCKSGGCFIAATINSVQTIFTFSNIYTISFNKLNDYLAWVNLSKGKGNAELNLSNYTYYPLFNQTNVNDVSVLIDISNGLRFYLKDIIDGGSISELIYYPLGYTIDTSIKGTITTDKAAYNTTETMLYNYTLQNAPSGISNKRIQMFRYNADGTKKQILNDYIIENGIGNKSFYIPSDTIPNYQYYMTLQYYNETFGWITLSSKTITISKSISSITFEKKYYYIGETLKVYIDSKGNGYITIINPNGIIKLNNTVFAGDLNSVTYYLNQEDVLGNWTARLYLGGIETSSDFTIVQYDIIVNQTPTPTSTPTPTANATYPGGSGRAWTPQEMITWLSIYVPLLLQFIFVFLFIIIPLSIVNMIPKRRRR